MFPAILNGAINGALASVSQYGYQPEANNTSLNSGAKKADEAFSRPRPGDHNEPRKYIAVRPVGTGIKPMCEHNGKPGISGDDIVEHLGNGEYGSAARDWCDKTKSQTDPVTGQSRGNNGS